MLSSLIELGLKSTFVPLNSGKQKGPGRGSFDAYPTLLSALKEAEKSGLLAAERRKLIRRRMALAS
jgi:hypothetical protein